MLIPSLEYLAQANPKASPESFAAFQPPNSFFMSLGITNCRLIAGLSVSVPLIDVLTSGELGGRDKFGLCGLAAAEITFAHHYFRHWRSVRPRCRAEAQLFLGQCRIGAL